MRHVAAILLLYLCFGCTAARPVVGASLDATPDVAKAVEASFSFQRARSIDRKRAIWFVDNLDGVYPIIYVGFDMGWHTSRLATLRVREHGVIERQEMRDNGELMWIADK
jgi:hypothetical protein